VGRRQQEADMGRYVILLAVPFIIGVIIAVGVVALHELRERRIDARRALLEPDEPDDALQPTEPVADAASDLTHRRIA
jgi:hypothetical protein